MGRLGNTVGDGCQPLGAHLLGVVLQFVDDVVVSDSFAEVVSFRDGVVTSDYLIVNYVGDDPAHVAISDGCANCLVTISDGVCDGG